MVKMVPVWKQLTLQDISTTFFMSDEQAKRIASSEHVFFYERVTKILLEHQVIFLPLYEDKYGGRPAVCPAVIMAASVYAERFNLKDRQLIDGLWTNDDIRRALGMDGCGPVIYVKPWSRHTHMGFRKRVAKYLADTGIDLAKEAMKLLTDEYAKSMNVNYDTLRSDSTLIAANIKNVSRDELLFDALMLFSRDVVRLFPEERIKSWGLDSEQLKTFFKNKTLRNQLTYYGTMTKAEVRQFYVDTFLKFVTIAEAPCNEEDCPFRNMFHYKLMYKVFMQQCVFEQKDDGSIVFRMANPGEPPLKASNIQSLFDLDCAFRQKGDVKIRGYSFNTVEAINQGRSLIVDWTLHPATKADIEMLKEYIEMLPDVSGLVPESSYRRIIADGAYYSEEMRKLCLKKGYKLIATDLTGDPGNPFLGQFQYSEVTQKIEKCPAGHEPMTSEPANEKGKMKAHMDSATCDSCPHRAECCASKKKASVTLTASQINRGKMELFYTEEEGKASRNVRSGIEGVQGTMKNRYGKRRMRYRTLAKNSASMSYVVGNMNLTKLWEYEHGTGNYVHNETLTG